MANGVFNPDVQGSANSPLLPCVTVMGNPLERFNHDKKPIGQLKELLDLQDEQFEEIRWTIKSLVLASFDVNQQGQVQPWAWSRVRDKLRKFFPDVFNTREKLAYARQVVLHDHRASRRAVRAVTDVEKMSLLGRGRSDIASGNGSGGGVSRPHCRPSQARLTPRETRVKQEVDDAQASIAYVRPSSTSSVRENSKRQELVECPPLQPLKTIPSSDRQEPQSVVSDKPRVVNNGQDPKTDPTRVSKSSANPIADIHRFLRGCSPSLEDFLVRFVEVGFVSFDLVREVAGQWTSDERRELTKGLVSSSDGRLITVLELAALERGFQALRRPKL